MTGFPAAPAPIWWGGQGHDTLDGGSGNDTLYGEVGYDLLRGGEGRDWLWAGQGDDTVRGDAGDDFVMGDTGQDQIAGGAGQDSLAGGLGGDTVDGGAGNDVLWGGAQGWPDGAADILNGGAGDDELLWREGEGNDTLDGGTGRDALAMVGVTWQQVVAGLELLTAWVNVQIEQGGFIAFTNTAGQSGGVSGVVTLGGETLTFRGIEAIRADNWSAMGNNLMANGNLNGQCVNDIFWGSNQCDTMRGGTNDDIHDRYGDADTFVFDNGDWGWEQISVVSAAKGEELELHGSGASFSSLNVNDTMIGFGENIFMLYGLTSLSAADCIFY